MASVKPLDPYHRFTRAEWSRFRGPNGTGVSTDKNVPVEWKDDAVLWKLSREDFLRTVTGTAATPLAEAAVNAHLARDAEVEAHTRTS